MQRKASKKTRLANAEEKRFHAFTKEASCICCGMPGPSILDHCQGATFKLKYNYQTVLIGHWFCLPLCLYCDSVTTRGSRRAFREAFGLQSELWIKHIERSGFCPPSEVYNAIAQSGM